MTPGIMTNVIVIRDWKSEQILQSNWFRKTNIRWTVRYDTQHTFELIATPDNTT